MALMNLTYNQLYSAIRGMDIKSMSRDDIKSLISLMEMKKNQLEKELHSRTGD